MGGTPTSSGEDRKTRWWSHPTTLALIGLVTVLIPLGAGVISSLGGSNDASTGPPTSTAPPAPTATVPGTASGGPTGGPSSGPSGAPSVLAEGDQILVVAGQCLDVDSGLPDCALGSDVEAMTGFPCVPDLDPHSGSLLRALGPTSPAQFDALDRDALAAAAFAADPLTGMAVGDGFIVRSADGNVAKILVESESECDEPQSVTLRFVTYLGPDGLAPTVASPPPTTILVETPLQTFAPGQCWDAESGPNPCGLGSDIAIVTGYPCVPEIDADSGSTLEYLGPKTTAQFDALGPDRLAVLDYAQDAIQGIAAGEAFAIRSADGNVAKARADAVSACNADETVTLQLVSYQS